MAKVKEDVSRVRLEVDGKQGINTLGKLEMEAKELRIDLKNAKKGTEEYVKANKQLKQVEAQISGVRKELGLTGMTMTQLSRHQRDLRRQIQNTTTKGTAEYRKLKAELIQVNKVLGQQRRELAGTAGFFGDIKKELKSFAVLAVGALGITELFAGIQNLISGSAELSDSISDVQKTTELTKSEMKALMRDFKTFNTRTPRAELLALADEAGKMGLRGVKNISLYVQETNELTTALGDLGENAGLKVAKMAERFDVSMRQIGSGINAVADNTKATAPFITEFLSRLGGIANEVGIKAGDILGYGAAIDEMGLNVEMSSTALNKFFIDFTKNTEQFGTAAGFAEGELTKLVGEQGTNQGFLAFLERLKEANPESADFLKKLEQLGIDGARGSQVFLALSQNVEQLRNRQNLANEEIAKGTSLTEEYNRKNENFAGNLERIQKWFASFFINGGVLDGMSKFVGMWADWIKIPISQKMETERVELQKLYLKITDINTSNRDRIKLIEDLKAEYPQYLGHLDAELTTNEDLSFAIKRVNTELLNKIILQRKDEELENQRKIVGDRIYAQLELEDQLRAKMVKVAEDYNLEIDRSLSLAEAANKLAEEASATGGGVNLFGSDVSEIFTMSSNLVHIIDEINEREKDTNTLLEERERLMERLGMNYQQLNSPQSLSRAGLLAGGGGTEDPVVSDEEVEEFTKGVEQVFEDFQSSIEVNAAGARDATELMFDQLVGLGEKFNVDMSQLEAERAAQRKRNQQQALQDEIDIANAKQMIAQGLSTSLGAAIDFIGNRQGELTGFQKMLTIAQIAIDSAAALGKIVPLAVEAASGSGPAAPFVLAGYIATMTGTVFAAIARAKQALTDSQIPDWSPSGGDQAPTRGRGRPDAKRSFYYGGYTGDQGLGSGDEYGEFAGAVHKQEYVIPAVTLSDPYVANLMPAIEQIRQDNLRGFGSGSGGMNTAALEKKMDKLIAVTSQWPKEITGKWVYSELEKLEEEEALLKSRYKAP